VKWNNFGWSGGSLLEDADEGMLVRHLVAGNTFLDGQWNNFYDGNVTKDISNPSGELLEARGNYWDDISTTGPVDVSSAQSSANPDAGPGGAQGRVVALGWQAREEAVQVAPAAFQLEPAYPNPFNPRTVIRFVVPEAAVVGVVIVDVGGRVVRRLVVDAWYAAGPHQVEWDGRDELGRPVASGLYFYEMTVYERRGRAVFRQTRKLVVMR